MCVILYTEIDGKKILAKNRDRPYKPHIEVIHEIVNGIELAYIRDLKTGWIEGMNDQNIGIINSTLDRTDGNIVTKRKKFNTSNKKNVIYTALTTKNDNKKNFYDIIKKADKNYILEGNTLLLYKDDVFHIENTKDNNFVAKKINDTAVFSNHGTILKDRGYTKCKKGLSSFLRRHIIKTELKNNKITTIDDLVNIMNRNYKNIDPRFHPYRDKATTIKRLKTLDKNQGFINTTGNLVLNMTDKELIYYVDKNNSKRVEYINNLPNDYTPKIRIIIKETEKNLKPRKIFTKKYMKKLYKRFDCKTKKNRKSSKNHDNDTNDNNDNDDK